MSKIQSLKIPISNEDIENFESKHCIVLPKMYRNFLLENNISHVNPNNFNFIENYLGENTSSLEYFYGLNSSRKNYFYSLDFAYEIFKNRIPMSFLPIGCDPNGNQILLHLSEESIWFWDHELEANTDEGELPSLINVSMIAQNIDLFIANLFYFNPFNED